MSGTQEARGPAAIRTFGWLPILALGIIGLSMPSAAQGQIKISQLYSGAGGAVTTYFIYKDDYVELYNPTAAPVTMTNWSLQYESAAGTTGTLPITTLNATIPAKSYYLVKLSTSTGAGIGVAMATAAGFTVDVGTSSNDMAAAAGKIILLNNTTVLATGTPTVATNGVVDMVGYGTTANWNDTAAAGGAFAAANNAPAAAASVCLYRKCGGDQDTDNNATDFFVGLPSPRNSTSTSNAGISNMKGLAEMFTTATGNSVLFTVDRSVCTGAASTGGTVTVDTSTIGGPGVESMFDDGTNGDRVAGDAVFSLLKTVSATAGDKMLRVVINDGQGRSGGGFIPIKVGAVGPANDLCAGAIAAGALPATISGTTVNATPDLEAFETPGVTSPVMSRNPWIQNQENGVWYTVVGTGNTITVSDCALPAASFDMRIRVYCGSCAQFSNVIGNDTQSPACASPSNAATVSWCSASGTTYYIYVSGSTFTTGTFTLSVTDNGVPCNQPPACNPQQLTAPGGSIPESDSCGSTNNSGCDGTLNAFQDIAVSPTTVFGSVVFSTRPFATATPAAAVSRERDWYRLTLTQSSVLTVTVQAEFPSITQVLALSAGGICPTAASPNANAVLISVTGNPSTPYPVTAVLPAGTYTVLIDGLVNPNGATLNGIANSWQCGTANTDYIATFAWEASGGCCLPGNTCIVTTSGDCTAKGGSFQGAGSNCGTFTYAVSSPANTLEDISTTGAPINNFADDTASQLLPIGFPFYYFGESRAEVYVTSNGILGFANSVSTAFTPVAFPNAAAPNDFIAPYWYDFNFSTAGQPGTVRYQTKGTAPNRRFIAQWTNVPSRSASPFNSNTFQVILFEGSNAVEFRYGTVAAQGSVPPGSTAVNFGVGLENFNGTIGTNIDPVSIGTGNTARLLTPSSSICGPPANDNCASPLALATNNLYVGGNTALATNDGSASCDPGGAASRDVWYTVTLASGLTAQQNLRIETCTSVIDTSLAVYTGSCGALTEIACNDNCGGSPCGGAASCLTFTTLPAGTYLVRVSDKGLPGGAFNIRAAIVLVNDACANASQLCPGTITGSNVGATSNDTIPAPCVTSGTDVWYSYTPATSGSTTVTTCNATTTFDTVLAAYTGACGALTQVACNDDDSACTAFSTLRSTITFAVTAGTTYLIRVAGFSSPGATGTYGLALTGPDTVVPCPPSNDTCATASTIAVASGTGTAGGNSTLAVDEGDDASCAPSSDDHSVWWTFTTGAAQAGTWQIDTCGSAFDTVLTLYSGTCFALTEIACNDDASGVPCAGPQSAVSAALAASTPYFIRVASHTPGGAITVHVNGPPPNDNCAAAIAIATAGNGPGGVNGNNTFATLDGPATACGGTVNVDRDVWYSFLPNATAIWEILTCGDMSQDTVLEVFDACGGNVVACNDDSAGCGSGAQSYVTAMLSSATTYRIRVASKLGGSGGAFNLVVRRPPPPNDLCSNATPVAQGSFSWSNVGANTDGVAFGSANCAGSDSATNVNSDVWFLYTATCTATTTVETCTGAPAGGSNLSDTVIAVYSFGPCPPPESSKIICDDDIDAPFACANGTLRSWLTYPAVKGTQYFIRVGSFSTVTQGDGVLNVSQPADTTPPSITQCAMNATVFVDPNCDASIPDLTSQVMASDNCPGTLTVTQSPPAGSPAGPPNSSTMVTLTATDAAGNSSSCMATVSVVDNIARMISNCGSIPTQTRSADASCQYTLEDLTPLVMANDNCPGLTLSQSPVAGTSLGLGTTGVMVTATDSSGNSASCTINVDVIDDSPPTITSCAADQTVSADSSCQAAVPDFTGPPLAATDNCSAVTFTQSPTAGTLVGAGDTTITLTATDADGNQSTCMATLHVIDDTPPTITSCAADQTVAGSGNPCEAAVPDFTGPPLAASDNCSAVTFTQSPAAGTLVSDGDHVITITAEDADGNTSTCMATLHVTPCTTMVTIVSASPPNGLRDSLQNSTTTGAPQGIGVPGTPDEGPVTNYGMPQVTFSGTPNPAPDPSNITVSCTGGVCPTVTAVSGSGAGPYTLTLSGSIPVLHCTTFTFAGTAAGVKLQYIFATGDTNQDNFVNTQDLLAIVQALNNPPADLSRYDIDRSGAVNTSDLLREVQLLNGTAGATQVFNGATIAACP